MKINVLIIATRNSHKSEEIGDMIGNMFKVRNLRDFDQVPEAIEDADTFVGNATKKAVTVANWLASSTKEKGCFVLADDSGLEVHALNGAPGVHSARFAALDTGAPGNSPDAENNAKLLHLLAPLPRPWAARFRCVLALTPVPSNALASTNVCDANEAELATRIFEGSCEGQIVPTAKGAAGFGYDPLFIPNGYTETFAELGEEIKNRISHRAKAMEKLKAAIL